MNRRTADEELLSCPKCGKEYSSFYDECPYCEAERTSKAVIKYGRVRGRGEVLGSLILTLALIAGGVCLAVAAVTSGGLSVGREYAVETVAPETVQAGVTEEKVTLTAPPETPADTTGGEDGEPQPTPEGDGEGGSQE